MAGAKPKYRHLSRHSAHRQALLRNLVTSLIEHETIQTTWPKAKEAQRVAEKLITLAKKNTEASRRRAHQIFYNPIPMVQKLFGPIRERYLDRPGGYTRVLRIEPIKEDQAPSAILELVDGPKDIKFAMTARTLAYQDLKEKPINEMTAMNIKKVTQFRKDGEKDLERMVRTFKDTILEERKNPPPEPEKKKVYPVEGEGKKGPKLMR